MIRTLNVITPPEMEVNSRSEQGLYVVNLMVEMQGGQGVIGINRFFFWEAKIASGDVLLRVIVFPPQSSGQLKMT